MAEEKDKKEKIGGITSFMGYAFSHIVRDSVFKKFKKEFEDMGKYAEKILKKQEIDPRLKKDIQKIIVRPEIVFFLKEKPNSPENTKR